MSIPLSWHLLYEEMAKDVHGLELSLDTVERLYTEVELKAPNKIDTVEETEIGTLKMMLTLLNSSPEKKNVYRRTSVESDESDEYDVFDEFVLKAVSIFQKERVEESREGRANPNIASFPNEQAEIDHFEEKQKQEMISEVSLTK